MRILSERILRGITTGETTGGATNSGNHNGTTESPNKGKHAKGDKLKIGNTTYTVINSKTKEIACTKTVSKCYN